MRRFFLLMAAPMILLAGCTSEKQSSISAAAQAAYEGYYKAIEDNSRFADSSLYYTISAEMSTLEDGTHRYYIFLDNAQIAMYDVVMMAVEDNTLLENADKMMPSIGIFDSVDYSMIPFQSYPARHFVKGLVISGECENDIVDLKLIVEWKDKTLKNSTREFIGFTLTTDGYNTDSLTEESAEPEASEGAEG